MADLTDLEKKALLDLARETIRVHFTRGESVNLPAPGPACTEKRGVFVTLHRDGELRGCIGYPAALQAALGSRAGDGHRRRHPRTPAFPPSRHGRAGPSSTSRSRS